MVAPDECRCEQRPQGHHPKSKFLEIMRFLKNKSVLLLSAVYVIGALHVVFVFTVGEPYPSLQGPMFAGHLQEGDIIRVPVRRPLDIEGSEKRVRYETLAIPIQGNPGTFGKPAQQFMIGHSLRVPDPKSTGDFDRLNLYWKMLKFETPLHSSPRLIEEEEFKDE